MLKKLGITAIAVSTLALTGCQSDFEKEMADQLLSAGYKKEWSECAAGVLDDIAPDKFKESVIAEGFGSQMKTLRQLQLEVVKECDQPSHN